MNTNKPQIEDGYVRIATELTEQFSKLHLSGNEWQVLWVVIRKTWGWQKKSDTISLTQFQKITQLLRPSVVEAVTKLVGKKVLLVNKNGYINEYSFNKDYSQWNSREKGTSLKQPKLVPKKELLIVPKKQPKLVPKKEHTKDNKDTITKERENKELAKPIGLTKIQEKLITLNRSGISREWQDFAFRSAEYLSISLKDKETKGRWLKFFKTSNRIKVQKLITYLKDYSPFQNLESDEHRVKYFFAVYYKQ
jgi:phage replication O-like protein O